MARNPWVLPDGFDGDVQKAIRAIRRALRNSGKSIPAEALQQLQAGNIDGFLEFMDWDQIRAGFGDLQEVLASASKSAGTSTFTLGGIEAELLFNLIDERAVEYAQTRSGQLIVEITDQMRETVRNTIASAQAGEKTFQQAARELQSTIPLSSRDAGAVSKYIDKQFQRFMRQGVSEAKARVRAQNMGARYAGKLLDSRTRTIARTEIIDASMSGRYLGWEAGVSAGYIASDSVKEWIAEPDACPICRPLDGMIISWNDPWSFPDGVTAGSNDLMPPAHPNCRCSVVILPPDFSENVFTPASGGEMPDEASEFLKHLPGKHDQSQHGRKRSGSKPLYDTSTYFQFADPDSDSFSQAMSELTNMDGQPIDPSVISMAQARLQFRSTPAPEDWTENFDALDESIGSYLKENPVSVMVPEEVIGPILDDGRIKTAFDQPDEKGNEYLEHRMVYERTAFGYDQTFPIESRPVSGAVLPEASNTEAFQNFGENYGTVQVVLKDSVKDRTTYTIGDSLDRFQQPTPYGGKPPRTFDLLLTAQSAKRNPNMFSEPSFQARDYIETQVHGGVNLSDIAKIIFHSPMIDIPAARLAELGIEWEETNL
jgi:hypothetical protein